MTTSYAPVLLLAVAFGTIFQLQAGEPPAGICPNAPVKTLEQFEASNGEPGVLLDSARVCFFVPKRLEKQGRIIFPYLENGYEALYEIVGQHTNFKIAVYAFHKGHPLGYGNTHLNLCTINYHDGNLTELESFSEWKLHRKPHVSGYLEEMGHNFVEGTKAIFGWEMTGWSISVEATNKVAGNPYLSGMSILTREEQEKTFKQYLKNGFVFPKGIEPNKCDRIHAWLLYEASAKYGPKFWPDFFREIRERRAELTSANTNARYQITIQCFDKLTDGTFSRRLKECGISLTTDVTSLDPMNPKWDRRLSELVPDGKASAPPAVRKKAATPNAVGNTKTSVFDRPSAQFSTTDGKMQDLLMGCKLYADREFVMKTRPRQLSTTRYFLASYDGVKVRCERGGVAFLLALGDPHNQEQKYNTLGFIEFDQWNPVPEIHEFSLYYTNGADRPAKVYWKQIEQGAEVQIPKGSILCFR